jgi:hypothetical protein
MKNLILLALGAVALYQTARRYNINSLNDVKSSLSDVKKILTNDVKKLVKQFS